MSLNLATVLETGAAHRPQRAAIISNGRTVTYAQLNAAANRCASGLARLGVHVGDKVAIMLPNVPEFVVAYFGILKLGGCVIPLNTLLKAGEIAYQLEDADASTLIVEKSLLPEAQQALAGLGACRHWIVVGSPPPRATGKRTPPGWQPFDDLLDTGSPDFDTVQSMPDDTAVILYTAGASGRPKGAELTHFNAFYNAALTADRLCKLTAEDVSLAVLPLFHAIGQTCVMNATLYAGGKLVLLPRFEPDRVLQLIERERVTVLVGVPTLYWYLQHYPAAERYDWSSLRLCCSGGAALPVELLRQFEERYGRPIFEGYGLSETSPVASFNPPERGAPRPGSIGLPIYGVQMKIVDEKDQELPPGQVGEIVIRGHNIMKGYYKRPGATAEVMRGGWFHSGDLGRMDEEGYFYIVGRKKDLIIRGGLNIYPREVEDVLLAHPAVAEVAVVGVPDEVMGEEIKAFVVLEPEEAVDAEDLIEYARKRLAAYKYPRSIEFRTELPKDAAGNVLKRQLKEQ